MEGHAAKAGFLSGQSIRNAKQAMSEFGDPA
jgi:hypothetical protein